MDILEKYKDILISELIKIYPNEDLSAISFELPRDSSHGDFSTNAALILSKKLKINPNIITLLMLPGSFLCLYFSIFKREI